MSDSPPPRLVRRPGDAEPAWDVFVDGVKVGVVARYSFTRAGRGRWPRRRVVEHEYLTLRAGISRAGFRRRRDAVEDLGAAPETVYFPPSPRSLYESLGDEAAR